MTRSPCGPWHLNVRWMRLGIQHQRIRPASPQENGAHERLHRTADAFRAEYNEERPHTHHSGKPPGSQYDVSTREYPSRLSALQYPGHSTMKRVTTVGSFRIKTRLIFIANALRGNHIGLDGEADGVWSVYFGDILRAKIDERNYIVRE